MVPIGPTPGGPLTGIYETVLPSGSINQCVLLHAGGVLNVY
jgi:hypothetical protein